MISKCLSDPLVLRFYQMEGEVEEIMTGELFGAPWRIRMDKRIPQLNMILDWKTTANIRELKYNPLTRERETFAEAYGYAVLLEEVEEAREALTRTEISLSALWAHIRDNNAGRAPEFAGRIREHALDLATEAVQAAAMAQKFIDSAKKEDHHEQSD